MTMLWTCVLKVLISNMVELILFGLTLSNPMTNYFPVLLATIISAINQILDSYLISRSYFLE
jgi:hypothetical protein